MSSYFIILILFLFYVNIIRPFYPYQKGCKKAFQKERFPKL